MALHDLSLYALILQTVAECDRFAVIMKQRHDFNLADQLERASLSIGNNFSEGYGRSATGERLMLMFYADGSVQESKNCLLIGISRSHVTAEEARPTISKLGRISIGIIEFCASILDRDIEYRGSFRDRVERRRAWRYRK